MPSATNFATTQQNKLQAGAHWKLIADDLAKTVAAKVSNNQSIYLNPPAKSAFNQAFQSVLLTALVNQGVNVVKQSASADVTVDVDTQLVKFSADRQQARYAGTLTALTAGVWALHGATLAGGATAGVALFDAYTWFHSESASGATPQNEIFVTVTTSDKNRYIGRSSSVYYIADSDQGLYSAAQNAKTITVYGDR
ncbi:MAG: hypothetical protein HOP20_02185 [Sulfuriferula sp.]|nr:hypothetical protein [Sulfuriferula sp.]